MHYNHGQQPNLDDIDCWIESAEMSFDPSVESTKHKAATFERLKAFLSHTIHQNAPEAFMIKNAEAATNVNTNVHRVDSVILKGLKEPLMHLQVLNNQ